MFYSLSVRNDSVTCDCIDLKMMYNFSGACKMDCNCSQYMA